RRASNGRQISPRALAGLVEGDGPVVLRRELGRPGPASARQLRRLRARGLEAEMARGTWHRALDAFLYGLRPRAAAQILRLLPAWQGHRLVEAAARFAAGPPSR